jgi:hypothetical protein
LRHKESGVRPSSLRTEDTEMGTRTIAMESAVVPLATVDHVRGRLRDKCLTSGYQPDPISMAKVSEAETFGYHLRMAEGALS